jgi:hypothetical protein
VREKLEASLKLSPFRALETKIFPRKYGAIVLRGIKRILNDEKMSHQATGDDDDDLPWH